MDKSSEDGTQISINDHIDTTRNTIPPTPMIPSTYAKLCLVRRRISNSSQSDADYEIQIDECFCQEKSELLSGSTSGVSSDDNVSLDNLYQDFYIDLVNDIKTLLELRRPHITDNIHIGFIDSIH